MNKETLSLPVPYTLTMQGDGDFVAEWNPPVKSVELPERVTASSGTSGMTAIERLYEKLLEKGVISYD